MTDLTHKYVRSLFNYRDGKLYWKVSGRGRKIGVPAGRNANYGYMTITTNGKTYYTHRLIFLFHHGYLPQFLDHIDGDSSNNSIENLREATLSQNQHNRKKGKFRKSKPTLSIYKGVSWAKCDSRWVSHICIGGKLKRLGGFKSEISAAKAYDKAASEAFGKFAKLNID